MGDSSLFLNRSILNRALAFRSRYGGQPVALDQNLSGVVREMKVLVAQMNPDFGRFLPEPEMADSAILTTPTLASDLRLLVTIRDELRSFGIAASTASLLTTSITRIKFQFEKAAANDSTIADFYDVAGWALLE